MLMLPSLCNHHQRLQLIHRATALAAATTDRVFVDENLLLQHMRRQLLSFGGHEGGKNRRVEAIFASIVGHIHICWMDPLEARIDQLATCLYNCASQILEMLLPEGWQSCLRVGDALATGIAVVEDADVVFVATA